MITSDSLLFYRRLSQIERQLSLRFGFLIIVSDVCDIIIYNDPKNKRMLPGSEKLETNPYEMDRLGRSSGRSLLFICT